MNRGRRTVGILVEFQVKGAVSNRDLAWIVKRGIDTRRLEDAGCEFGTIAVKDHSKVAAYYKRKS